MGKKAKTDVDEKSAAVITDTVLAKNNKKLTDLEKAIKEALERKHKIIVESKLYTYGQLSELYGGIEGQELLDAVTAEHTLIGKLTASGMSYADIEGLVDSPAVNVSGEDSSHTDNSYSHYADDEQIDGQTSMF